MPVLIRGIFSGGGVKDKGYPVDTVIITRSAGLSNSAELQWIDPEDTTLDAIVFARWAGTKVVRKIGSAPENPEDGVLVIDSKTRNEYKDKKYVDSNLEPDTTYYYRFFTYTDTGVYNTDFDGIVKIETKYFSEVFGENTIEQIHYVISMNLHKEIWNIGDKIKIYFNEASGLTVRKGENSNSGYETFNVPAGYVEFMIADFDLKMRWADETLINSGDSTVPDQYELPEKPKNIVLVQSCVSEMLTFSKYANNGSTWIYPYEQCYLEEWLGVAKGKVQSLSEEDMDKYFEDIDERTYYRHKNDLSHLGGNASDYTRFKFFRFFSDICSSNNTHRWGINKKLVAFPDKSSIIFRTESGQSVKFAHEDNAVINDNIGIFDENGNETSGGILYPEYGRIFCAIK